MSLSGKDQLLSSGSADARLPYNKYLFQWRTKGSFGLILSMEMCQCSGYWKTEFQGMFEIIFNNTQPSGNAGRKATIDEHFKMFAFRFYRRSSNLMLNCVLNFLSRKVNFQYLSTKLLLTEATVFQHLLF